MKTKAITGPFADQSQRYETIELNFKNVCDCLIEGKEVICLRTHERLSMLEGVVFANFQSLTFDGFVKKYSRERFHQRRLVSVEPSEDGTIGKTESICNEISSPDCRHGSNRVNDTHSVNNNSDTPDA